MLEKYDSVYNQVRNRLISASRRLSDQGAEAAVEVLGVAHMWSPRDDILQKLCLSDIVTLELGREAVKGALSGENSPILQKSSFWHGVIIALRESRNVKKVRGIEVNQTARHALRRFFLHHDRSEFCDTALAIELDEDTIGQVADQLPKHEAVSLRKYHFVKTANLELAYRVINLAVPAYGRVKKHQYDLCEGARVVCSNTELLEACNADLTMTFFRPPHPSLEEAREAVEKMLSSSSLKLSEEEAKDFSETAVLNFLLAPTELTDAREIAYFLNQYCREAPAGRERIRLLHIGGAGNTGVISEILRASLPDDCKNIAVEEKQESILGTMEGEEDTFLRDHLAPYEMAKAVNFSDFDVSLDSVKVSQLVSSALKEYREDFIKRMVISRIVQTKFSRSKGPEDLQNHYRERFRLYKKELRELQAMAGI